MARQPHASLEEVGGTSNGHGQMPFSTLSALFFFLLVAAQPWSLPMLSKLLVYPPVLGFLDL